MITTLSDSRQVGVRYLYATAAVSSRGSGVQAETRGSQGWEGSGRATQAAAKLSVCIVLYSGTRIVARFAHLRQIGSCSGLLPLLPPARHSLGRPAACPPGRRGRLARRAPGHSAPLGIPGPLWQMSYLGWGVS